jgi:hypothetical protein
LGNHHSFGSAFLFALFGGEYRCREGFKSANKK